MKTEKRTITRLSARRLNGELSVMDGWEGITSQLNFAKFSHEIEDISVEYDRNLKTIQQMNKPVGFDERAEKYKKLLAKKKEDENSLTLEEEEFVISFSYEDSTTADKIEKAMLDYSDEEVELTSNYFLSEKEFNALLFATERDIVVKKKNDKGEEEQVIVKEKQNKYISASGRGLIATYLVK